MAVKKFWGVVFISLAAISCLAAMGTNSGPIDAAAPLAAAERRVWGPAVHRSEFALVPNGLKPRFCTDVQPPEALVTPDPFLGEESPNSRVTATFIVGTDGRVHGALILEGGGQQDEQSVLDVVRFWRYRPARCDGAPSDAEGEVKFFNQ